jgi:hypothetical protein
VNGEGVKERIMLTKNDISEPSSISSCIGIIKNIFIPSFRYKYSTKLIDLHYSESLNKKLNTLGAHILKKETDGYQYIIRTSQLLKRYRMGKVIVTIHKKEKDEFDIDIEFQTQKVVFLVSTIIISIVLLIGAFIEQKIKISVLLAIPFMFMGGHLYFGGSLVPNVPRIRKFFIDLGD